jgi:hypothetical protein
MPTVLPLASVRYPERTPDFTNGTGYPPASGIRPRHPPFDGLHAPLASTFAVLQDQARVSFPVDALDVAAARWKLTRRQRQVLELVTRGLTKPRHCRLPQGHRIHRRVSPRQDLRQGRRRQSRHAHYSNARSLEGREARYRGPSISVTARLSDGPARPRGGAASGGFSEGTYTGGAGCGFRVGREGVGGAQSGKARNCDRTCGRGSSEGKLCAGTRRQRERDSPALFHLIACTRTRISTRSDPITPPITWLTAMTATASAAATGGDEVETEHSCAARLDQNS